MKIKELISFLNDVAPFSYQESYDNSGLLIGNESTEITGVLVSLDVTEDVIFDAVKKSCNVVLAHHPLIFSGVKKLTGSNYIEKTIVTAIKQDVAVIAFHTNLDNVLDGVNRKILDKLGCIQTGVLVEKSNTLVKGVFYGTKADVSNIQEAIFKVGAGQIGNYTNCSYKVSGEGSFKPTGKAKPTIGALNIREILQEDRVEIMFPKYLQGKVLAAAKEASSYEELAYDIVPLSNKNQTVGSGAVGVFNKEIEINTLLQEIKTVFGGMVRYTKPVKKMVKKIAICGGSGSFLLEDAIRSGADVFLTSDFKYHQFFDANDAITIIDIGHYENEQFTSELLVEMITKKISTFAVHLTDIITNPVNYI